MSKRVIGYEGRRPIYREEGPACARGLEDSLAATIMVDLLPVLDDGSAQRREERREVNHLQREVSKA